MMTNAIETWVMKEYIKKLLIIESKILRRISELAKEGDG